ncbi:hypothetical protein CEUSTIGMA_g10811.t1 [Chlamydomonas eustigma]|uniref:Uncharacterized protein n=1 Tax=Chlamydomonas eustigma TaxID=1157962 RepID=A0A250XK41_9CHLO|nr:hypothetical protein CEUSTIGMA_g10811.t1 [Chlamydomonas eustigma]|eukprot:GAX83386.1 hypothetical protein CEUSTIGMA_g10811.t1 [Chlamydomonas eustigma]
MAGLGVSDPRRQAHLSLTYKAEQPHLSASKSYEQSLTFKELQTSNVTTQQLSNHNSKSSGKTSESSHFSRQRTEWEDTVQPPFLSRDGKWLQDAIPNLIMDSQGQPLTTTGSINLARGMGQAPKAISAIHSYHDMSPVLTTEYTRDTDRSELSWDATINKRGTNGVYQPTGAPPESKLEQSIKQAFQSGQGSKSSVAMGDPTVRKNSVDSFHHRNGSSSHVKQHDLARIGDEIGSHAIAGNANAKLIGGKWRYMPRPTEGVQLYTDFYGRFDDKHCDYFGRTYHYLPQ